MKFTSFSFLKGKDTKTDNIQEAERILMSVSDFREFLADNKQPSEESDCLERLQSKMKEIGWKGSLRTVEGKDEERYFILFKTPQSVLEF